ncbi:MAG: hypothetical protein HY060_01400 [Proteobacteria bacterium]|nr:hypothetical protein [Pseudomonadota bacterium]
MVGGSEDGEGSAMPDGSDAMRNRRPSVGATPNAGLADAATATNQGSMRATALHAYDDTLHAGERGAHRLDILVSTPRAPRKMASIPVNGTVPGSDVSRVVHEVGRPYQTSFKFGFGFTAGAWTFRAIVQTIVGAALLILIMRLLSSVIG